MIRFIPEPERWLPLPPLFPCILVRPGSKLFLFHLRTAEKYCTPCLDAIFGHAEFDIENRERGTPGTSEEQPTSQPASNGIKSVQESNAT